MDYKKDLNPTQAESVGSTEGPVMVIAGAGSGKTRVLTYRIAYLISKGIDPFNILSLTFTNKAAKEMKERIGKIVGDSETKNLWMGTFHSVFAKILRIEAPRIGYPSNFTIYDQQDALNVMKKVIQELQLDKDLYKTKQVLFRISQFKNSLITVRSYFNNPELIEADKAAMRPHMGEVYKAYVAQCFKNGAMDFDDLLLRTNEILTRFPEVLAKYQDRFRYILVDEYQDTNHSQYLIVKALASKYENICVVGDDAQSIYSFRGANIQNILGFQKDYPDAKMYRLEQNYRSTQNLVNAANSLIEKNKNQLQKNVWTSNEVGDAIPVYRAMTDADEAQYIAGTIFEQKQNKQLKNVDFAILYRTNAQSRALEEALRKRGIPYKVFGGISFYHRKEIKDLVAYLRLLVNPNDQEALLRIINFPARGIGQTTLNKLIVETGKTNENLWDILGNIQLQGTAMGLNNGIISKLDQFYTLIESYKVMMKDLDIHELALHIVKSSGLMKMLKEDDSPEGITRLDNLQELLSSLQGFVDEQIQLEDGDTSLSSFLENIALATDSDKSTSEDQVSLMTIHLAKGLEFPVVFITGMEEDLFPSMMSVSSREDIEEERRLFYVALTRSEKQAYLSYSISRYKWGKIIDCEPSRFLEEIDPNLMDWVNLPIIGSKNNAGISSDIFGDDAPPKYTPKYKSAPKQSVIKKTISPLPSKNLRKIDSNANRNSKTINLNANDRVKHDRFGSGTVKSIEGANGDEKATILFDNIGEKKLLLRFAKLTLL